MESTRLTLVKSQHSSTEVIEITLMFVKNQFKNMSVTNFFKYQISDMNSSLTNSKHVLDFSSSHDEMSFN